MHISRILCFIAMGSGMMSFENSEEDVVNNSRPVSGEIIRHNIDTNVSYVSAPIASDILYVNLKNEHDYCESEDAELSVNAAENSWSNTCIISDFKCINRKLVNNYVMYGGRPGQGDGDHGQSSDIKTGEYVSECKNECTEKEKRCIDGYMQICMKGTSGCLEWQNEIPCGNGKMCNPQGTQCEYACGTDCEPFSIILLPDTQYYTRSYRNRARLADGAPITEDNSIFVKQAEWIVEHKDDNNIRFVIHLGDITDINEDDEWENSVAAMKKIASADIPFSISTGNHDYRHKEYGDAVLSPLRTYTKFSKYYTKELLKSYFKGTTHENMAWFHGFEYGANSYSTFSAGNIHFLVLALEYYPRKDVIAWADSILNDAKYSDYHVIVETHGYLQLKGDYMPQRTTPGPYGFPHGLAGEALFDEFIQRHSNIFLVVSGHVSGSKHTTRKNLFGNSVHEILVDYQAESPCQKGKCAAGTCSGGRVNKGNGWLRQIQIDPKTGNVTGTTHSAIGEDPYIYGSINPKPHMFCTQKYSEDPSSADHSNHFTIDISPANHQYSEKDIYDFVPRDVNEELNGDQINPVVAMNRSNGNFVIAWEDNSSDEDGTYKDNSERTNPNFDIAIRSFNRGGYVKQHQKYITIDNSVSKGNQISPDLAMDEKGNFVVVWADDSNNDNDYDIYMSGFDSDGNLLFSNIKVNKANSGNQTRPKIAMAPDGRFVVSWNDQQKNDHIHIKLRAFNADGKPAGSERNILNQSKGTQRNPSIAMDAQGNYVIAWESDNTNNVYQIRAQKYDFDGKELSQIYTINSKSKGQQLHSAVGMNGKGAFYVAYRDDNNHDEKYDIRVRGWDENLNEIIADTKLYSANHNNEQPTICVDDSNHAVVGFYDSNMTHLEPTKEDNIKVLAYDTQHAGDILVAAIMNGKIGNAVSPTELTWQNQKHPSVSCSGDGHVVVVYTDDTENDSSYEIYVRGYNAIADIK